MTVLENCVGSCCRNPFKVCFCGYECQYHIDQQAIADKQQEYIDFVNGLTTAPGLARKRNR